MRLDGLRRKVKPCSDLLVLVTAGDQLQHLALSRGEVLELRVVADACPFAKRIEHESGKPRREHGVACRNTLDGVGELVARDRLRDVASCACANHADHVLRSIRH